MILIFETYSWLQLVLWYSSHETTRPKLKNGGSTFYTICFSDTAILLEGIRTKFDSRLDRRGALTSDSQPSTLTGTHLETNLLGLMNMRIINPNDAESTVKVYFCIKNGLICVLILECSYF